jgi:hypothetical protein
VFLEDRTSGEWGSLESRGILESVDGATLRLPMPFRTDGATPVGDNWTVTLAPSWIASSADRAGDSRIVRHAD